MGSLEESVNSGVGGSEQVADAAGEADGRYFVNFWPRRWRVFARYWLTFVPVVFCGWAILNVVFSWPRWQLDWVIVFLVVPTFQAALHAWWSIDLYPISVSESAIHGVPSLRRPRLIPLANLDRERSSHRNLYDRMVGQQRLYSTTGQKIYLYRSAFTRADLRRLLALLELDESAVAKR